jgi:hypothetical protein
MLKRREQAICKCCGQRLLIRHGVQLSPLLADLLDMVERCKDGIACETLAGIFYPGKSDFDGRNCIHANVVHLNAKLAETDIEVRAPGYKRDSAYRIIKRCNP